MKVTIENEMNKRLELVDSIDFRKSSAKVAQQIGITAEEWEKNKSIIIMYFANEFLSIENN